MTCARWTLTRALFALAGTITLASVALGTLVTPWFLLLAVLVGLSQWAYVASGHCPASLVLSRVPCLAGGGGR
jgi:hypothetical protein